MSFVPSPCIFSIGSESLRVISQPNLLQKFKVVCQVEIMQLRLFICFKLSELVGHKRN